MPQEPVTQDPVPQEPTKADVKYATDAVNLVNTLPPTSLETPGAVVDWMNNIQNPRLKAETAFYVDSRIGWNYADNLLTETYAEETKNNGAFIHDTLADPAIGIGGSGADLAMFGVELAEDLLNFVERGFGVGETDLTGDVAKTAAKALGAWSGSNSEQIIEDLYGYDGDSQDFFREFIADAMLSKTMLKAEAKGGPGWDRLQRIPKQELRALSLQRLNSAFDAEAEDMGMWDNVKYGFAVGAPQVAEFVGSYGGVMKAGAKGAAKAGGMKASQAIAKAWPRLGRVAGITSRGFAMGAGTAALMSTKPLNPFERDYVEMSDNPEKAYTELRVDNAVRTTVSFAIAELGFASAAKVGMAIRGGDSLTGIKSPLWRRGLGVFVEGQGKGMTVAALPIMETIMSSDGAETSWGFIKDAFAGELDFDELKAWAGHEYGAAVAPIAMMSMAMHLRATPGMSPRSKKMVDEISKQIIKDAPLELKQRLVMEQISSLDKATSMYREVYAAEMKAADVATKAKGELGDIMRGKTRKSDVVGKDGLPTGKKKAIPNAASNLEQQNVAWLQQMVPELTVKEAQAHVRRGIERTEAIAPKSGAEAEMQSFVAKGKPMVEAITEAAKNGNFSIGKWQNSDTGAAVKSAYSRLFMRRLWSQTLAFESALTKRAEAWKGQGQGGKKAIAGGGLGLPGGQAPAGAGRAQGRVEGGKQPLGLPEEGGAGTFGLKPQPMEAAPSNPAGPKYPKKMHPGPRMLRMTKEIKAWAEANNDYPGAAAEVQKYVENREGRMNTVAAIGRVIGDHSPKVVEQWDNIVQADEWDVAASNVVAFFGRTVSESGRGREGLKRISRAIVGQIKEFANSHGQPEGSTPATNEAQILRRVVGTLTGTPGGMKTAEWLLTNNVDYITDLFARESNDKSILKKNWAKGRKQYGVYIPPASKTPKPKAPRPTKKRQESAQLRREVEDLMAMGALQSMADYGRGREAARTRSQGQMEAPAAGATPTETGKPKPPATTEGEPSSKAPEQPENVTEKPVEVELNDVEMIVDDMMGVAKDGPRSEEIGGARIVRTELMSGMKPIYTGHILLESVLRHPELQPREHSSPRGVDERRVANYVSNFKPEAINPGKFAWLEKDGKEGWYLLDGHHTYATLQDVGNDSMLGTFLRDVTWDEAVDIARTQNNKRESLTTIETAKAVTHMVEGGRFGGLEAVAKEWNKKAPWAQRMVDIANLPDSVHQLAATKNLGENETSIEKTLAKLGEAKRLNPDAMNDMAVERVARKISQHKWYNTQAKITDFLDVYQKVTSAEQSRADSSGASEGFLFDDYVPTREALDIIAEITEARAVGKAAARGVSTAKSKLTEWSETATGAEKTNLRGSVRKAERELALANQKTQYLDLVKDRVIAGTMDIDTAMASAKDITAAKTAKQVQAFLEDITKPHELEVPDYGVDNPTLETDNYSAQGPDSPGPISQRSAGDNASGASRSDGGGGKGDGSKEGNTWHIRQRPAGQTVAAVSEKPPKAEKFTTWKEGGVEMVYSNRKKALARAQGLAKESPNAEYVVYPENPAKPTGKSRIGWRQRLKKAVKDFMDKVTERPDFKEAMRKLKGMDKDPDVDEFFSGLDLNRLSAAMDIGKIFLEVGLQSAGEWGAMMKSKTPKVVHPYLRQIWNSMTADPAWEHLPSWTEADSASVGLPKREVKPSAQAAKEYAGAFRTPKESPGNLDRKNERMTLGDQLESVRAEDLQRAQGRRAQDETFLLDPFLADLPEPTQRVEHPVRAKLRDHQKYIADSFVTAMTTGKKGAVLDSSGTGTGKTWTAMATALELQSRNGGKIVLVTSNNAAIESWRINDFNGMEIDPGRIGFLKDIGVPEKDIILMSYYNFQTRASRLTGEKIGKLGDFDVAMSDGTIGQIIWDEAHRAGTWYKGTTEAQRVVERMDAAWSSDVKQIFATASPFDDPAGMRWMEPLGIWGQGENAFRGFLDELGYRTVSKGKDAGFTIQQPDDKAMPYVHLKLIRLRQMLAEQGQQIGWDMSAEGVENVFMKLKYSKEQGDRYWAVAESYEFLRDALQDAGMRSLSTMSGAWRVNHAKRMLEDIATENAIEFALSAFERGGRFLFLSSYKSPKASGSLERILTKVRGSGDKAASAIHRIALNSSPEAAEKVLQFARKHDAAMGSQPPILDHIDRRLRAAGMRGMKISGEISPKERVAALERWKDGKEDLDFLVGTRATLGESISAQDTYGRQIYQFIASVPWTGREVVQELGRAHRIGEVTKPVIAWAVADEFPSSSMMVQRVAARLHHLRAGVQGMRSDPTNLENAKDTAAFFLSAKDSERMAMSQVIDLEGEILKAKRTGGAMPYQAPPGVDITPNAEFFNEPGEVRTAQDVKTDAAEVEKDTSFGGFEKWKEVAKKQVDQLYADLNIEQVTDSGAPLEVSLGEFVDRSVAARNISNMLQSSDIRGVENEAREYLDGLLAPKMTPEEVTEGLKTMKGAKGKEAGAIDLQFLKSPVKMSKFLVHSALRVVWADPLYYERPEYPEDMRVGSNRFIRGWDKQLNDGINIMGYRIMEPIMEAHRDWRHVDRIMTEASHIARKAAVKEQGYVFMTPKGEGWLVTRALNGERYDESLGFWEGRLGRIEEYQAGAREWTPELKQRAAESGHATAEAWLEAQPSYVDLMASDQVKGTSKDFYHVSRDQFDTMWKMYLSESKEYQYLVRAREKAFAALRRAEMSDEGMEMAGKVYAETTAKIKIFHDDKGIEDYFAHFWPDKGNLRMGQAWFKQINPKAYTSFVDNGRISHETGWLENPEAVLQAYRSKMLKRVFMDQARNKIESIIEGEWKPISTHSLLPLEEAGPQYTMDKAGQAAKLLDSLTFRQQKKAVEKGQVMKIAARRVRYEGKAYDAFPGKVRDGMRGLLLREPQSQDTPPGAASPNELFFSQKELGGVHLEARVGGLRQFGEKTEVLLYVEKYLEKIMGGKEYTIYDKAVDTSINYFYSAMLGFFSVKAAETNLLGGTYMMLARLGPVATSKGVAGMLSPGELGHDVRLALAQAGLFSKVEMDYHRELVASFARSSSTVPGQMAESARLTVAKFGKLAHTAQMGPFLASESFLQMTAFSAGYVAARSAGYSEKAARLQGLRARRSTQMWSGSEDAPMISWGTTGRAMMQFMSYLNRSNNLLRLNVKAGWRGIKDAAAGYDPRPGDVNALATVVRLAGLPYLIGTLYQIASQAIMNNTLGDDEEENQGLDVLGTMGIRASELPGADSWWGGISDYVEKQTGLDVGDLVIPGLMAPQGVSPPVRGILNTVNLGLDEIAGDPKARERYDYEMQKIILPQTARRFLQVEDVGGENSDLDKKVEAIQERMRGFSFLGMTPFDTVPQYKDYRKLGLYYDKQRPFLMTDEAGNEKYAMSGPMTQAQFWLIGRDPRISKSIEHGKEMWFDRDRRLSQKGYVKDAFKALEVDRRDGGLPEGAYKERYEQIRAYAKENNIDFGIKNRLRWEKDALEISNPAASRIINTSPDEISMWENLVTAAEKGAITFSAFFEAERVMSRKHQSKGFLDWRDIPGNRERLEDALNSMSQKRSTFKEKSDVDNANSPK